MNNEDKIKSLDTIIIFLSHQSANAESFELAIRFHACVQMLLPIRYEAAKGTKWENELMSRAEILDLPSAAEVADKILKELNQ